MYEYQKRIFEHLSAEGKLWYLKNRPGMPVGRRAGVKFMGCFDPRSETIKIVEEAYRKREAERIQNMFKSIPPMSDFLRGFGKEDKAMDEIVVNGVKYKRVDAEEPKLKFGNFKLKHDAMRNETDLVYDTPERDIYLLSIKANGKYKLYDGIPEGVGFSVDSDGELFEESSD